MRLAKVYRDRMERYVDQALAAGVRFFVTSLGDPRWVADRVVERLGVPEDRVRVIGPAVGRRPVPSERDTIASIVGVLTKACPL